MDTLIFTHAVRAMRFPSNSHKLQKESKNCCPPSDCTIKLALKLAELQNLAHRLSALREMMPTTNVSKLVSKIPSIVLDHQPEDLAARLSTLRQAMHQHCCNVMQQWALVSASCLPCAKEFCRLFTTALTHSEIPSMGEDCYEGAATNYGCICSFSAWNL